MTTAAIDLDMLNELLDNQKKLDDVFGADDDFFFGSSMAMDDIEPEPSEQSDASGYNSYGELSFESEDEFVVQKSRNIIYVIMPVVVELALIYYGVTYFL